MITKNWTKNSPFICDSICFSPCPAIENLFWQNLQKVSCKLLSCFWSQLLNLSSLNHPSWNVHLMSSSLLNDDTNRAEIMWVLEVLLNRYSYRSCINKSSLFAAMFKDSKIPQNFKLGKTKWSFVICHGLVPHF